MIFLGPAGVPISSDDGSTVGGVKKVAELGLNAMEVEFVRGVSMGADTAKEVGRVAADLGVRLSVHCPYFVNLCTSDAKKLEASKKRILDSVQRAHQMKATIAVFHPGYYGNLSLEEAFEAVKESCADMLRRMRSAGIREVKLGLETTGKVSAFGTLDEIVDLCEVLKGCEPVVDFAHIWARQGGRIDYREIFAKVKPLGIENLHCHFTSMEWSPAKVEGQGNEKRHLPIEFDTPPFRPLAEEIMRRDIGITIISESPVLEQDSLKMRRVFEQLGYKF
ncbi:MAG: TIM barrel protein [Candidatus Hadarchaeales archaeon]